MKKLLILLAVISTTSSQAQSVDSIYFNLYTDSLKKGVYNYINVDGLLSTGSYIPLMANEKKLFAISGITTAIVLLFCLLKLLALGLG